MHALSLPGAFIDGVHNQGVGKAVFVREFQGFALEDAVGEVLGFELPLVHAPAGGFSQGRTGDGIVADINAESTILPKR